MEHPKVQLNLDSSGKGSVKVDGKEFPVKSGNINFGCKQATLVTLEFYASVEGEISAQIKDK